MLGETVDSCDVGGGDGLEGKSGSQNAWPVACTALTPATSSVDEGVRCSPPPRVSPAVHIAWTCAVALGASDIESAPGGVVLVPCGEVVHHEFRSSWMARWALGSFFIGHTQTWRALWIGLLRPCTRPSKRKRLRNVHSHLSPSA